MAIMLMGVIAGSLFLWWPQAQPIAQAVDPFAMEKVGDGAWKLNGRESVQQTIKTGEIPLNVSQSKVKGVRAEALTHLQSDVLIEPAQFKWSAESSRDTVFALGLMQGNEVLPVVQISRNDGYFVRYYPVISNNDSIENLSSVSPKADKNIVTWELRPGISARYTVFDNKVKADYIAANAQSLEQPLQFVLEQSQGDKQLISELMPSGEILFIGAENLEYFEFPAPVTHDDKGKQVPSHFSLDGQIATINLNKDSFKDVVFPITIDPMVVDSGAMSIATSYGNARHLVRDAYGNLVAFSNTNIFIGSAKEIFYKAYDATTWVNSNVYVINSGTSISDQIAGDIDSSGNIHVVGKGSAGNIYYNKLTLTRNGSNSLTGISAGTFLGLTANGSQARPSLIIANRGGGAGVEKVAVAWASNESGGGGGKRGQIRFLQCDVADDCSAAANWKNASESETGSGGTAGCVDGTAGLPNDPACTGAADSMFTITGSATTHHGVIAQMPGKPKRTPTSAKLFNGTTYTNLSSAIDGNAGTAADVSNFDPTDDFIYIGDDRQFSKVTIDLTNTNSAGTTLNLTYWDGDSWEPVANPFDNTDPFTTTTFNEDGSLMFDQMSDWATTTVDGDNKYWIRLHMDITSFDASVSIAELYLNDRNSRALIAVGGDSGSGDLRATYVPWDEISDNKWENLAMNSSNAWNTSLTGSSSAISNFDADWTSYTNFPLAITVDHKNYSVYVGYLCGICGTGGINILGVKNIFINESVIVSANWEASLNSLDVSVQNDANWSMTSDGGDIYVFYVADVGTSNLSYRKCSDLCNSSGDWGSAQTFDAGTDNTYPQAVVTKIPGDTVAIDVVYTTTTSNDIEYERQFIDLADKKVLVSAGADDAYGFGCSGGGAVTVSTNPFATLGRDAANGSCGEDVDTEIGFRFQNVTVSPGATISSAYLDFRVDAVTGSGSISFTASAEDADNPVAFNTGVAMSSRTLTSNNHTYSLVLVAEDTYRIDLTRAIQEVVCRGAGSNQPCVGSFNSTGAWASGNSLNINLTSTTGGVSDNWADIYNFESASTNEFIATLHINLGSAGKDYSAGVVSALPSGSGSYINLDHPLSSSEFTAAGADDTSYAYAHASNRYMPTPYPVFMLKQQNSNNNNTYKIDASVVVQSDMPCTSKTIYLQVYRGGATNDWVTQDSDTTCSSLADVTLTSPTISTNLSDYYFAPQSGASSAYWTYWRVYQDPPGANLQEALALDYVNISYSPNGPDHVAFTNALRTFGEKACNGDANKFTIQLQDSTNAATNPTGSTVMRVSSNSSDYTVYSDNACSTVVTNGDFTFSNAENTKDVYIIDRAHSNPTWLLTAAKQSGPETITSDTQSYTIQAITQQQIKGGTRIRGGSRL